MDDRTPSPLPPKRSDMPSLPAKRRKVSNHDAGSLKLQYVFQSALSDTHHLEEAKYLCGIYNRLMVFVQKRHDATRTESDVCRFGSAFQDGVEAIHDVIRNTHRVLELGIRSLRGQMELFNEATINLDRWYEGGDLFCESSTGATRYGTRYYANRRLALELPELIDLLGHTNLDAELDYYIEHVHRIIPKAFRQMPTEDEMYDRESHTPNAFPTHVPAVLSKAITLIQPIIKHGRDRDAFHVFVTLKAVLRKLSPRVYESKLNEAHEILDKVMGAFVAQIPVDKSARSHIVGFDGHLNVRLELQDVKWRQLDTISKQPGQYWDFASAARILQTAYLKKLCVGPNYMPRRNREYNPRRDTCIHTRTFELLDWLQTKAWSEIRARVFQAVGPYFPAEITEDTFEFALVAEGIPLHPRLEENVPVRASDSASLESQPPGHDKRLKANYRCWYVERMRECSSKTS